MMASVSLAGIACRRADCASPSASSLKKMNANANQISYHTLPCCATFCAGFSKIFLIRAPAFCGGKAAERTTAINSHEAIGHKGSAAPVQPFSELNLSPPASPVIPCAWTHKINLLTKILGGHKL